MFLGFVIDTEAMEVRLLREKLIWPKNIIVVAWQARRNYMKHELSSLFGKTSAHHYSGQAGSQFSASYDQVI